MENENKDALEERLTAVSFAIYDTVLYLDAYPESARALAYLSNLRREKAELAEALRTLGAPPATFSEAGTDGGAWEWTNGPWPWQNDGN